jgi:hypothetical protein
VYAPTRTKINVVFINISGSAKEKINMTKVGLVFMVLLAFLIACGSSTEVKSAPTINSFTATPNNLQTPGDVTLEWDVTGASSLSINQSVGTVIPNNKSSKIVNVSATQTFTLTATNSAGSVTKDVTVNVAPFISITPSSRDFVAGAVGASFDAMLNGSSDTINWTLSGPGTLSETTGPSVIYIPPATIATLTTATLTATAGTLTANATISIAPAVLTNGVLFYKSDGSGEVVTLSADGTFSPVKTLNAGDLPANVTHFGKPYDLYELLYSSDGSGALGSFDGAGNFRKLRTYAPGALPTGQSHVVSLADRLVFYSAGTTLCGGYSSTTYDFANPKTQPGFATDWNLILRTSGNGVLFYRNDGIGAFGTYDANCNWAYLKGLSGFTQNWSHLVNTPRGILFYKASNGVGAMVSFAADGTPTQTGTYASGELSKDWEQVINTSSGVLFYKSDGSGELGTFDAASKYLKTKSYAAGELPTGSTLVMPIGN